MVEYFYLEEVKPFMKRKSAQDSISSGVFTSHIQVWICKVPILMEVTRVLFERRQRTGEKDSTIPSWTVSEVLPSKG